MLARSPCGQLYPAVLHLHGSPQNPSVHATGQRQRIEVEAGRDDEVEIRSKHREQALGGAVAGNLPEKFMSTLPMNPCGGKAYPQCEAWSPCFSAPHPVPCCGHQLAHVACPHVFSPEQLEFVFGTLLRTVWVTTRVTLASSGCICLKAFLIVTARGKGGGW